MGNAGGKLVRSCIKKHRSNIRKKVHIKFVVTYNTTKLNFLQIRKIPLQSHYLLMYIIFAAQNSITITSEKQRECFWEGLTNMVTVTRTAWFTTLVHIKSRQIARLMPVRRACARKTYERHPIFWARKCYLAKKKKMLDIQIFSRMGKTTKMLHSIPDTIANSSVLVIIWYGYIFDVVKTYSFTHGLRNI